MSFLVKVCSVLAAFALILGAAGCGSDAGSSSTSDEASLTKAEFVERGDKICLDNYGKREEFLTKYNEKYLKSKNPPSTAEQEEVLVNDVMPIFEEQSEELGELPLPETEAKEAEAILAGLEEAIEKVKADPATALKKGTEVTFSEVEKRARAYGFEYCGRS